MTAEGLGEVATMKYADLLDLPKQIQWRGWASIPRPAAYESAALPTELPRQALFPIHLLADESLTNQGLMSPLLFQLSYGARMPLRSGSGFAGAVGAGFMSALRLPSRHDYSRALRCWVINYLRSFCSASA